MEKRGKSKILFIVLSLFIILTGSFLSFFLIPKNITGFTIYNLPVSSQNFIKSSISASDPYNSLVLYYPFDMDLATDYRSGYNGVNYGASLNADCIYLNCSSFDGNSYISVPGLDGANLDLTQNYTISAWVKTIDNTGTIFSKTEPLYWSGYNHLLFVDNNKLEYQSWGAGIVTSLETINQNTWTHIALTYRRDTKNVTLYINGQYDTSGQLAGYSNQSLTSVFRIGRYGPDVLKFKGSIDEFMLFNQTLTNAQISFIHNNQSSRFSNTSYSYAQGISTGNDRVNITLQNIVPSGTSIDVNLNFLNGSNGSWNSAGTQPLSSINTFNISLLSTNLSINLILKPDSHGFFSPILLGDISLKVTPLDTQAPTITFEDPSTSSGFNAQSYIEVNITAVEPLLNTITLVLRNSTGILNLSTSTSSPFYKRFDNLPYNSYILVVTANDSYGNSATLSRNIDLVQNLPTFILTGSTSVLSDVDLTIGTAKTMNVNDKLKFNMTDMYTLTLTSYNNQTSTSVISINGLPSPISLSLGESKKINLNGDNAYDILIKFEGVSNNKPQISIRKNYEIIPTTLVNQSSMPPAIGGNPGSNVVTPSDESSNKTFAFNKETLWLVLTAVFVLGIIIIIIAVSIVIVRNLKNKSEEKPTSANLSRKLDTLMRDI